MKIKKLKIENFKVFRDVSFVFNEKINIFTGINNSGKTTVLEAIALWKECFNKLIKQAQKKDTKLKLLKGDYRLGDKSQNYFNFEDIVSIRSPYYEDIFYNLDKSNDITLEMIIEDNEKDINIGFKITKANGSNYEIKYLENDNFDYPKFNNFFNAFPNPINTLFASPIANLLLNEEFVTKPIINDKIVKRESIKVLRNRLYELDEDLFEELQKSISFILDSEVLLTTDAKKLIDTNIDYDIKLTPKDIFKNISLVGSGTIQILEILLSVYANKKELNIILLDEPDSHIHRDIQNRLIKILLDHTKNTQIFITTHNESLIRSANPEYIFHLEGDEEKEYVSIINDSFKGKRVGLQPSKQLKILESIGSESALDFVSALESDRLIFVEGKTDPFYIDAIFKNKYLDKNSNNMYWSFDGSPNIFKHILSYKELFSSIKNEVTLWDKSILIFDRDYLTDSQAKKLQDELQNKLKIPVYIWKCYTAETVLLTDIDKFIILVYKYISISQDCNKSDIRKHLYEEIAQVIKLKKEYLEENKSEIKNWIDKRRDEISDLKLQRINISFEDVKTYHLEKLENNDLSSLATKTDIENIISNVVSNYIQDDYGFFDKLLDLVDKSTYFDEWNNMFEELNKKSN